MTRTEYLALTKEEQKEVKKELWQVVKDHAEGNDEVTAALQVLKPSLYGTRSSGGGRSATAKHTLFSNLFENVGDEVDEMEIFKTLKAGRKECSNLIRSILKKSIPTDRKWITFNPEEGVYTLVGKGEKTPKNWVGYVPPAIVNDIDDLV